MQHERAADITVPYRVIMCERGSTREEFIGHTIMNSKSSIFTINVKQTMLTILRFDDNFMLNPLYSV